MSSTSFELELLLGLDCDTFSSVCWHAKSMVRNSNLMKFFMYLVDWYECNVSFKDLELLKIVAWTWYRSDLKSGKSSTEASRTSAADLKSLEAWSYYPSLNASAAFAFLSSILVMMLSIFGCCLALFSSYSGVNSLSYSGSLTISSTTSSIFPEFSTTFLAASSLSFLAASSFF